MAVCLYSEPRPGELSHRPEFFAGQIFIHIAGRVDGRGIAHCKLGHKGRALYDASHRALGSPGLQPLACIDHDTLTDLRAMQALAAEWPTAPDFFCGLASDLER